MKNVTFHCPKCKACETFTLPDSDTLADGSHYFPEVPCDACSYPPNEDDGDF